MSEWTDRQLLARWAMWFEGREILTDDGYCPMCWRYPNKQEHSPDCLYNLSVMRSEALSATTDRNPRALLTKLRYYILNHTGRHRVLCRDDYNCEWVYPYGFVPEAGCPYHD